MKRENGKQPFEFITNVDEEMHLFNQCKVGWSEKHKSWKMQQFKADSERLPSIFPPWQIPTMVGFCPWWLWWESVRWQIPTISDDEEIFLVQFRPKCWSQHGATSTRTTNRQLFMLLRLCPRNARNLHGLSNFYIHSILVIIIIMLELNRSN